MKGKQVLLLDLEDIFLSNAFCIVSSSSRYITQAVESYDWRKQGRSRKENNLCTKKI